MMLNQSNRKLLLTSHITFSVGWLGSIAAFLAIAVIGLVSNNDQTIRGCYIAMEVVTVFVIVPASLASFSTGVIQGLGTPWGLFKYYWVVVKLVLTLVATIVLLLHLRPINILGEQALSVQGLLMDSKKLRIQVLADAAAALFLLTIITGISIYKPWGKIKSGSIITKPSRYSTKWLWRLIVIGFLIALVAFVLVHLSKGKLH